jgi:Zn-dependent protease
MEFSDTIFLIVVIIFSAVDPTARYAGRLTFNPIPHLDPIGSVLVPILLAFSGASFFFAWAKPVPYNPYNLRPGRFSEAIVAGAGPLSNLVIALVTGLLMQIIAFAPEVTAILFLIVAVNVMLFLFNLFPIPPLDGSKILSALLPGSIGHVYDGWRARMEYNPFLGMGLVVIVIVLFGQTFGSFVFQAARLIAGV